MYINFRKVQIYRNHKTPLYYNQLEIFFIIYPLCKDTQYYYNSKALQQVSFKKKSVGLWSTYLIIIYSLFSFRKTNTRVGPRPV